MQSIVLSLASDHWWYKLPSAAYVSIAVINPQEQSFIKGRLFLRRTQKTLPRTGFLICKPVSCRLYGWIFLDARCA